ncbi:SpoIID/LytB domain-containing protein [bacterium]|nr:SpoIID/LytB domain-containing protein [bacterium]
MIFFQLPCHAIKIGLIDSADRVIVGTSNKGVFINPLTNKSIYNTVGMKAYELKAYKSGIGIKIDNKYYDMGSSSVVLRPESGFVSAKNRWYRGLLMIYNLNGKLVVVNKVDIEDYIRGVVPSEMPASWNIEAHKAQAIAARSYALANLGKRAARGYDLKDTPEDQAYGGASAEKERTNKAVDDTKEVVLIYDLKIIPAYYSASAGGKTKNSGDVWMQNLPYLQSVPSYDDNIKKNGHGVGMSQHGANNLAKSGYNSYQILQYFYKGVKFAKINPDYFK